MDDDSKLPAEARNNLPDHAQRMQDLLGGINNIAHSIEEAGGVASQFPFIGINNDGIWAFGQDRTEVEPGSLWAIDIRTWKHGFIAWPDQKSKERKPLGERMVPASSPLPVLASLPDVGQPYQLQFSFELLCLNGEDAGKTALYKNGSYGCKVAVQTLVEDVRKQSKIDPKKLCPVVSLDIRSYFHQEWKKDIYNPLLKIQKWITFEEYDGFEKVGGGGSVPIAEALPEPEPEPAPAPQPRMAARGTGRTPTPTPTPIAPGRRRPGRVQPGA